MKRRTQVLDPPPTSPLPASGLTVDLDRRDHEARLAVTGELDLATQLLLTTAAADVLHPPVRALLLDLSGVTFCGAAGVTSLLIIRRLAADAEIRLVLTGVRPPVRRVLDIFGTSTLIPIAHSRAVGHLRVDSHAGRPGRRRGWRRPHLGPRARAA